MKKADLKKFLVKQKISFREGAPDYEYRLKTLKELSDIIEENKERLIKAVSEDFGLRATEETLVLEIFPLQDQIRHTIKNLSNWMKRKHVTSAWFLIPSSAYYQFQPLGSVGIMGAWNYQILLSLGPLIDAIAAGNHAILKPSEMAPRSAEVLEDIINSNFPEEYIHCVTGDEEMAKDFSSLPFDHLFFTGSTRVGKLIMAAAAPNLTPVTLELGGKSPAIIHASYPIGRAARRIMAGKLFNAGQTCVAPDYVIMPKKLNTQFEAAVKQWVSRFYPDISNNEQYSHIINQNNYNRLKSLLADAKNKGAVIIEVLNHEEVPGKYLMTPKLIFNVREDMTIMQEEIFGPLLPVLNIENLEESIDYVNENPKPLALYYFDSRQKRIDWVLRNTLSGGVTINDTVYHLAQHNLPFGGVGASGMGHYHGYDGFKTFSKKRPVMQQKRFASSDFLQPPYTSFKQKLIRFMGKLTKV